MLLPIIARVSLFADDTTADHPQEPAPEDQVSTLLPPPKSQLQNYDPPELPIFFQSILVSLLPAIPEEMISTYVDIEEDVQRVSHILALIIFSDIQPSTELTSVTINDANISIDLKPIFIHPDETPEVVAARVQVLRDIRTRSEVSSPESEYVSPVEAKLADLEHLGQTLELLIKETKYNVSDGQNFFEKFRT